MLKNEEITLKRVMEAGHKSLDIFTKLEFVKDLITKNTGKLTDKELQIIVCHCWYYKSGRYKKLTPKEHEILDTLLKNNLSPKTIYQWFLLNEAPEHIKKKVKERKIGYNKAISENAKWKKITSRQGTTQLIEEIRQVIGSLKWKSQE